MNFIIINLNELNPLNHFQWKYWNPLSLGVDIEVIQEGSGPAPKPGQKVSVHYTLTLEDGKKIDSSYDRGEVFEFTVGRREVISGWDEGIQKILLGSKVKATISPVRCYEFTTINIFKISNMLSYVIWLMFWFFLCRTKHTETIHRMIQCQKMQLYFLTSNYWK